MSFEDTLSSTWSDQQGWGTAFLSALAKAGQNDADQGVKTLTCIPLV